MVSDASRAAGGAASGRPAGAGRRVCLVGDGPLAATVARSLPDGAADAQEIGGHGGTNAGSPRPWTAAGLRDADVVVIDAGDDIATIEALHGVMAEGTAAVVAHVAERRLRRAVQERIDAGGAGRDIRLVSCAELLAERFMASERLYEVAHWRGQDRLHVGLVGFGPLGQACLEAVVVSGIAGRLGTPLVRIVVPDVEHARRFLAIEMPELEASAEIEIVAANFDDLADPARSPLVAGERVAPLTAILVVTEDPGDTLRAAAAIGRLQQREGRAVAAVHVGGPGAATACDLAVPSRPHRDLGRRVARMPTLADFDDLLDHILTRRDAVARRIHDAYRTAFGGGTAATDWTALPETFRRASRQAGLHLAQKLWTLGLSQPAPGTDPTAIDPTTHDTLIAPLVGSSIEDETMRRLARIEHDRWSADRRLDGWRYGDVRDDARRRHPSLVGFDDPRLTAAEIEKDIAQIRFLMATVLRAETGGARAQLTIGILTAATDAQDGVDLPAALDRLADQPDRAVVLLAPLLGRDDIAATAQLVAVLRSRRAAWRLIVPEWFPDNRTLRDPAVAGATELIDLLALSETTVAPAGPAGLLGEDVWEDPSGTLPPAEALATYVAHRADVRVTRL